MFIVCDWDNATFLLMSINDYVIVNNCIQQKKIIKKVNRAILSHLISLQKSKRV